MLINCDLLGDFNVQHQAGHDDLKKNVLKLIDNNCSSIEVFSLH